MFLKIMSLRNLRDDRKNNIKLESQNIEPEQIEASSVDASAWAIDDPRGTDRVNAEKYRQQLISN